MYDGALEHTEKMTERESGKNYIRTIIQVFHF